jgi:predicted sulfurtransferase
MTTKTTKRRVPKGKFDEFFKERENECACDRQKGSVVLFYKYIGVDAIDGKTKLDGILALETVRENVEGVMRELNVRGKIRVSSEGINATASGSAINVSLFEKRLKEDEIFRVLELNEVDFKSERGDACEHLFESASVRIVDELCPFQPTNRKVSAEERVKHIHQPTERLTAESWRERLLSSKDDDDVVVLDVRNSYESRMGRFCPEKTICAPIRRFNQFKEWVEEKGGYEFIKGKRIYAYCTGGVRCEKVSSYLLSDKFNELGGAVKSVSVLEGGIVSYARDVGDDLFLGVNYVFDARGSADVNKKKSSNLNNRKVLTTCDACAKQCLPVLARCASKNCHTILASCGKCEIVYCCDTCRRQNTNNIGMETNIIRGKTCECDNFDARERRLKVPHN